MKTPAYYLFSVYIVIVFLVLASRWNAHANTIVSSNSSSIPVVINLSNYHEQHQFHYGVATAAYQIEGGNHADGRGDSIWDIFSNVPGRIANNDNGQVADDDYHKIKEDIELIKKMGVTSYRFSISWSRIIPLGYGRINQYGIDHYNMLINELLIHDITPFVTLYHWDLPQALEDRYDGWLSSRIEDDFKHYADICFRAFGDRVKYWMTVTYDIYTTYVCHCLKSQCMQCYAKCTV